MAQTTQIVPKYSYPYVETVINDYTQVSDDQIPGEVDTSYRQVYAFTATKGINNVWVKKSSKEAAVQTFGKSNFKKLGQQYMQALHVLDQDNSSCWMMRVMPDDACYANAAVNILYKGDTAEDVEKAHERKFRVAFLAKNFKDVNSAKELADLAADVTKVGGTAFPKWDKAPLFTARYVGSGDCGNLYSVRISKVPVYEAEYGITMYNFESLTSESGLVRDASYIGTLYTSERYGAETVTLINDLLEDVDPGVAPTDIVSNEATFEVVYEAYIKWLKELTPELEKEYQEDYETLTGKGYTDAEISNGIDEPESGREPIASQAEYVELNVVNDMLTAISEPELPKIDEFDVLFGVKVNSSEALPGYYVMQPLTDDVEEKESKDYYDPTKLANEEDEKLGTVYTEFPADFASAAGIKFANGTNGKFDIDPVKNKELNTVKTEQEIADEKAAVAEECFIKAYSGVYDKRILSNKRMDLSAIWDANYPYSVKEVLVDLCLTRNSCRVYLDVGIIDSLSTAEINTLNDKYAAFNDKLISIDIHNYELKEETTNKRCRVTISYFLAARWMYHMNYIGFQYPFVKENCRLEGHVKDSILPIIEDYDELIKDKLNKLRFNYFQAVSENVFERATQNTRLTEESDLLEENDVTILMTLKKDIESRLDGELYDFTSSTGRATFINTINAIYNPWVGSILDSFGCYFSTSKYEFDHSILHFYIDITFRGLNKRAIAEIDINKRQYADSTFSANIQ